ncbi:MAG: outer membrane beta-barrel protein, partial [Muribaculaceae bacterium]|nr:outer membrane beta-barrel protein [Muribaculaceae bacterium]
MKAIYSTAIITLVLLSPLLASATDYRVKAAIIDAQSQPEPYVTWRIFSADSASNTLIVGNVTDEAGIIDTSLNHPGDYSLSLQGMDGGRLNVEFSVSDKSPIADLGFLTLTENEVQHLDELTVTAQKPLVVREIDRLAYDVKSDPESSTAPLIDILRKVPMVTVDGDGNITVNGSSNFKIYKNGRPNNSFTKNAKDLFKAIPASTIKKVEVITDPGAREDAEGVGAILNIVTDSDTALEGITGNVNLYGDSNNPIPTPRLWLSSQIGKVTFSLYGNYYNMNRRETENASHSVGKYLTTGQTLVFDEESSSKRNAYSGGFEMSYELDTLNLFTASMDIYQNYGKSDSRRDYVMTDASGALFQKYTQTSFYPQNQYLDIDGNVNYQRSTRRKGENITLSYQISTTGQKQEQHTDYTDMYNFPVPYTGIQSNFDLRFFEHTLQLDWTRPIASKHTLDVGAKYIARRNHSKNFRDYINSHQTYDDFNHNTDIAAAYADFRAKFGKFGVRGGFRYEYSRLAAKFHEG